ncbi:MAG: chlorite dismutase family protein [Actinomycetes bacterium]
MTAPVIPSEGWGVLHLFFHVVRDGAVDTAVAHHELLRAHEALVADGHQARWFPVLGHKADLGVMAVGPDLARLQRLQHEILATGAVRLAWSYVSLTEGSEYMSTEDDERARLAAEEGITEAAEVATRLGTWSERMAHYRAQRVHPTLPSKATICFYPMSKRRTGEDNWYALDFDARKVLMAGHARVGRTYAGRVVQLITGSTGLDDWEWGVTLFADDPLQLKAIVYEMRFDEVSARYAEFGPFVTGLVQEPADALDAVGLGGGAHRRHGR